MLIPRTKLRSVLELLRLLDASGSSSYLALEFSDTDMAFYRTSTLGFVRSLNYQPRLRPTIVSYKHFDDCCAKDGIKGDPLLLEHDETGKLWVRSTEDASEVRVYTVVQTAPWETFHDVGTVQQDLPLKLFADIDVRPFAQAQPVLKNNRLMLATEHGTVFRDQMEQSGYPYPRREFLKAVGGKVLDRLFITTTGYWGAVMLDSEILVSGHTQFETLFDSIQTRDLTDPIVWDAERLVDAVDRVVRHAGGNTWINFDPKLGVLSSENDRQSPGRFSFTGRDQPWPPFRVLSKTASSIATTVRQGEGDVLAWIEDDRLRVRRGKWEIHCRVLRQ